MVLKKGSITLQSVIFVFVQLLLLCSMFLFDNYVFSTIMSFVIVVFQVLIINKEKETFCTFPMFFLLLSYVLHMGRMLMIVFFDYEDNNFLLGEDNISLSLIFASMCHLMFVLGSVSTPKTKISKKGILKIDKKTLRVLAVLSILVGIYPRIYIIIEQLSVVSVEGYWGLFSGSYGYGIYSILELFYFFGIIALIFTETNILKARVVFVLACLIEVVSMLSGGRMYAISHMLVFAYVYCVRIEKPKGKQLLLIGFLLYFLCAGMSTVADIRNESFSGEDLKNAMVKSFGIANPIVELIGELGGTLKTLVYSVTYVPSIVPLENGKTYFNTLLLSVPFLEEYVDSLSICYLKNFPSYRYLGGSWLGEIYFNFSWLGIIFAYLLGKICGSFERVYKKADKEDNYFGVIVILSFLSELIVYARDYFAQFSKSIQLAVIIIICGLLINFLFKNVKGVKVSI